MIKVEVIKDFTLERFEKLKNIVRRNEKRNEKGKLYVGDTFECDKEMADYLMGDNKDRLIVVKVLEVIPEEAEVIKEEEIKFTIEPKEVKSKSSKKKKKK